MQAFTNYCKAKNLSPRTLEYYDTRLTAFLRWVDREHEGLAPVQITPQIARQFVTAETGRAGASLGGHSHTALKAFLTFLVRDGIIDSHPMRGMEKPALSPLPSRRYEFLEWKTAKVGIDYHISAAKHFYSVPVEFESPSLVMTRHANVRGSEYYKN